MGKGDNPNSDFTYGDRFQRFVTKLTNFARVARSKSEIDNSPDGIFEGEQGELLTKFKNQIYYRKNDSNEFVSLSDEHKELMDQHEYVLSQGVNKTATWTKKNAKGSATNDWAFTGYFCPIAGVDCCITGAYGVV
jgi:hypothetical protein